MDNATHTLLGLALARTRLGRASPLAPLVLAVGANLPDLDLLWTVGRGSAAYLELHRGWTHGVFGIALQIVAFAWCAWRAERRWFPERAAPRWHGRGGPLLPAAAGILSHPLLDLLNPYGLRPWLPFDASWVYVDLVFIADPWGWLLLGAAAALAGRRTRAGDVGYALLALALLLALYGYGRGRVAGPILWCFPLGVVAIAWLRAGGRLAAHPRAVLGFAAVLGALYLGALAAFRGAALDAGVAAVEEQLGAGAPLVEATALPVAAEPSAWTVLVETEAKIAWLQMRGRTIAGPLYLRSNGLALPPVLRAIDTPAGGAWRAFARFPMAEVGPGSSPALVRVRLADGRFFFTDWCQVVAEVER